MGKNVLIPLAIIISGSLLVDHLVDPTWAFLFPAKASIHDYCNIMVGVIGGIAFQSISQN